MKKIIANFKKAIRFIVTIFASREFAFVYCLFGIFTQVAHTYFLTNSISSFVGGFKVFQSVLLSGFISSSLLYFVAVVDNSDTKENRRNKIAVNIFMIIEILINLYYYSRHLIIDAQNVQIFDFIFAILISCLIPVTIKLYGSHIRAKEWEVDMENKKQEIADKLTLEDALGDFVTINEYIEDYINKKLTELPIPTINTEDLKTEILDNLDGDIAKIFQKNQALFIQQFENKCKLIIESKNKI